MVDRGLVESRARAQALIMAGEVRVDGELARKAGQSVTAESVIEVNEPLPWVSRGGAKLEGALDQFGLNPKGLRCADVGACTGGFTDVLLQRGATRVYAIDVGYGQLAWSLRQDERVVVIERTNARHLDALPEAVELVVMDVSFISIRLLLPTIARWLPSNGTVVSLVKPQFEAGRDQVGRGGIVRDPAVHRDVLRHVANFALGNGWLLRGITASPITGAEGNREFFVWLQWQSRAPQPTVDPMIEAALRHADAV
ncbi:MAG: TlyA family RNA methyltransferase [Ardenticatenales bacterium]|nr:TlyA family RNA methyltransferase [Ardenticatenales bacterium]